MKRFFDDARAMAGRGLRGLSLLLLPLLGLGLALGAPFVAAQSGAGEDLRALFPRVAEVDTQGASGLVRAPLPAEVLEAVRADLADVRVFSAGQSVEFAIEAEPPRAPNGTFTLTPLDVREQLTGDRAQPRVVETWDVLLPTDAPATEDGEPLGWRLSFGMAPGELVRELSIHRVDAEGVETPLVDTTLFRMQAPLREKLSVSVPPQPGARLRLRLSGPAPAQRPTLTLNVESAPSTTRTLSVPLELVGSERSADLQETVLTLQRPRGIVPDALVFETESGAFHREVVVEDAGVGARRGEVGRGVVFSIPSWDEARLTLPIEAATGDQLRVRVLDLDAPPLASLRVSARVRQPALVFESYGSRAQLFFGGARATRPAYGLGDLQSRFTPGAAVSLARVLPASENPHFRAGPVLAFAMRPGAPLDAAGFSHTRRVRVPETPEGLVRVPLDVETLARARSNADDVRVVDAEGRQWPFLFADEPEARDLPVTLVATPRPTERATTFAVTLPGTLHVDHLRLAVSEALVSRPFEVWGSDALEAEPHRLRTGTLERGPTTRDPELRVVVDGTVRALELRVRDGDEQPLRIEQATVVVQVRDLFMAAPPGDYRLLVGNATIDSPYYDVESARELVLSLRAVPAELGPLEANPSYAPPSPSRDAVTETALLVVLGIVVLLLGALTFRLVQSDTPAPAAASAGEPRGAQGAAPAGPTTQRGAEPESPLAERVDEPSAEPEDPLAERVDEPSAEPEGPRAEGPDQPADGAAGGEGAAVSTGTDGAPARGADALDDAGVAERDKLPE